MLQSNLFNISHCGCTKHTVAHTWTSQWHVAEDSAYTKQETRQTNIHALARFEPANPEIRRLQTYALERTATGTGIVVIKTIIFLNRPLKFKKY
jgi:hypothetical protein